MRKMTGKHNPRVYVKISGQALEVGKVPPVRGIVATNDYEKGVISLKAGESVE